MTGNSLAPTRAGTARNVYGLAGHLIVKAIDPGTAVREYIWFEDMPPAVIADVDTMTPHLNYVHADRLNRPIRMTDDLKNMVWDATR